MSDSASASSTILLRRIRLLLWLFIIGLVLSGATAIPLQGELRLVIRFVEGLDRAHLAPPGLLWWLTRVYEALAATNARYPFLAYGTDWLAFGHFMIAIAFIGPLRDPVKNAWIIDFGMIACALIVPFAFIMGPIRGIPLGWRLIDCSFGVVGIVPLWFCRRYMRHLVALDATKPSREGAAGTGSPTELLG